jgi:hypothetical protein
LYAGLMAQLRRRTSLFSLDDVLDQICADDSRDDIDGDKSNLGPSFSGDMDSEGEYSSGEDSDYEQDLGSTVPDPAMRPSTSTAISDSSNDVMPSRPKRIRRQSPSPAHRHGGVASDSGSEIEPSSLAREHGVIDSSETEPPSKINEIFFPQF